MATKSVITKRLFYNNLKDLKANIRQLSLQIEHGIAVKPNMQFNVTLKPVDVYRAKEMELVAQCNELFGIINQTAKTLEDRITELCFEVGEDE